MIDSAIQVYDFGRFNTVCDLGGGYGHFMFALLDKYSGMHGMVFERPEVIHVIKKSSRHLIVVNSFPVIFLSQCPKT